MQTSNSITDLIDLGITEAWTQLILQPGQVPHAIKSNGARIRVADQESLNEVELSSDLEALDIDFSPGMEHSVSYYMHKHEESGKMQCFKVVSQNFSAGTDGKMQKPIVSFFPWRKPASDLGDI